MFPPAKAIREGPPHALSELSLAASASNEFLNRYLNLQKNLFKLGHGSRHVVR